MLLSPTLQQINTYSFLGIAKEPQNDGLILFSFTILKYMCNTIVKNRQKKQAKQGIPQTM